MGIFVNPNNSAFQVALNSEIYVDKTELIAYTNKVIDTNNAFICNSRPRRFGKSIAANMLAAYYSKGCVSSALFEGLRISKDESFGKHLNQYNVIRIDVQWCCTSAKSAGKTVSYIERNVIQELRELYPDIVGSDMISLPDTLAAINNVTSEKFVIIIDEWDCLIRDEAEDIKLQEDYINLLRGLLNLKITYAYSLLYIACKYSPQKSNHTEKRSFCI